jgi:uncharacterized protein YegL
MNAPVKHPSTALRRAPLRTTTVLLLDTSGSMSAGEPRRIDLLWQIVQALRTPQARWRVATFNTYCRWSGVATVPEPSGTTDLGGAIRMIAEAAPLRVTLVTDGEPDDQEDAYEAAVTLQCPVNILFVGDPGDAEATAFCQRVCAVTKGTFATEVLNIQALSQTTATMRKMLGDGTKVSSPITL